MTLTRSIGFWLGIATGVGLLAFALRSVDAKAFGAALQGAELAWAIAFLPLLFGFYALKAVRWGLLVRGVGSVPFRLLFRSVIVGYAANAVLPAQLGDVVRALVAAREMGLRAAPLLASVFVERAFDLVIVAGFLGVVLLARPELSGILAAVGLAILLSCAGILVLLHIYARHTERVLNVVARACGFLGTNRQARFIDLARAASRGAAAVAESRAFAQSLLLSAGKWTLMAGCNLVSFWALDLSVPWEAALLVLAWTTLALILPSAPGYAGAIQAAYVLGLAPFGVAASDAVAASLFFHVLSYASVVVAGLAYMHASRYRFADLRGEVSRAGQEL